MCQSQGLYIKCIILCSHGKNLTDFFVTLMKSSFYDALISAMFIFQSMHIYTEHFALKF